MFSKLLYGSLVTAGVSNAMINSTAGTISLPELNVLEGSVTVSGLSSGGFMAAQMHVAYSSLFSGVGIFAGGPYYCAQDSLTVATEQCMYNLMGGPQVTKLISYTDEQSSKGEIDSTDNMADDKVYVFSGSKDTTVYPAVVKTLEDYYAPYVKSALTTEYTIPAQHCIPTLDYGEACGVHMSPYIGDCDYSGAGHAFQTFYGSDLVIGTAKESNLFQFDQTEFFTGSDTSINDFGFVYIPSACSDGSTACRLHISYHGCAQDYASIGDVWADHAGYNDWAEANNIIVVYPYAKKDVSLGNSNACWDWWGYTGDDYVLKKGVQMEFSKKVLDRVIGSSFANDDSPVSVDDDTSAGDDTINADDLSTDDVIPNDDHQQNDDDGLFKLKSYDIINGSVTVSGLSSGGFMAAQMHVAYSSLFSGVGIFAGGPYYCAQDSLTVATEQCMYNLMGGPQVTKLISYTDEQSSKGEIDSTDNMADDKVYVFSGSKDTTVYPAVVKTLEDYYAPYVKSALTTEYTIPAQHCIPTLDYGEACGVHMSPYIGDCDYSGAGHAFQTFYGSDLVIGTAKESNLFQFDQTEFFTGSDTSINDFGFVYIPSACSDGSTACRLHISYHGCAQDYASIGDVWADHAGYNDWAEANNIIVVYPYAKKDVSLGNSNACWDWWGYTGDDYVLKKGVQMEFSKKVLDRLMGN